MTKEVLLSLQGLQFDTSAEDGDKIETITPAEYYKRNGSHYVIFDEAVEGFLENTKNIIKFKENSLELTKKGLINVHMIFEENKNKQFRNSLAGLLPNKLIPVIIRLSGIDPYKQVNLVSREERIHLGYLLKHLEIHIRGLRGFNEAIITGGGIRVKEVNPQTMESKNIKNLYFAGEILDVDALTGGFNLQIAWSTAWLAAKSMLEVLGDEL